MRNPSLNFANSLAGERCERENEEKIIQNSHLHGGLERLVFLEGQAEFLENNKIENF